MLLSVRTIFLDVANDPDIPATADREQIREAYKRAAFANHPDRAINDQDRRERTARFQKVNEAHYVLSNDQRVHRLLYCLLMF
jgi:curved DNA-binding protein CbpA